MAGRIQTTTERFPEDKYFMSLLDESFEEFSYINAAKVPDGEGGIKITYTEGAAFNAAATLDSSMQAKIAEAQGVTSLYTVTTRRNLNLQYHEIIKRKRDSKIFRITSDGDDKKTPASAGLDMRQVSAEEYDLPLV